MTDLDRLRDDLAAEQTALDDVVRSLDDEQWHLPTSSAGWSVADQIGHLAYFDCAASMAIIDPPAFARSVEALVESVPEVGQDAFTLGEFRALEPPEQLNQWRVARIRLAGASATLSDGDRINWYGPPMGAKSFLTARLMETWAHGGDVAEAVGAALLPTDRIRHIAQLGYLTRGWSYAVRGEQPPKGRIRLELSGPSGETWTWGPGEADDAVCGTAEEFCLVVTQRRHLDDTALLTGELGRHWLLRAQAFAGPPSVGPDPREQ
ncbi:MAG: TIGR03084 family metal-binding protein [Acidimicrobiales bacterium]